MPLPNPIRILSVEDHPVFRQGLATVIGTETGMVLVGQAGNGIEAIAEFRRHRPDITLMDLRLPRANGTAILIAIRGEFPDARIIMLSSSDTDGEIHRALRAGASGYVLKSLPQAELLAAIRSVHAGKRRVPAEVAAVLAAHATRERRQMRVRVPHGRKDQGLRVYRVRKALSQPRSMRCELSKQRSN